jgi:hypothetical protein
VKRFSARTALISLFVGFAAVTQAQAEDYYIYQTPNGALVITNNEPPPGSKIIKRFSFPEANDGEVPQGQTPNNPPPNGKTESSPKPSKEEVDLVPPRPHIQSVKLSADSFPEGNYRRSIVGFDVEGESVWLAA